MARDLGIQLLTLPRWREPGNLWSRAPRGLVLGPPWRRGETFTPGGLLRHPSIRHCLRQGAGENEIQEIVSGTYRGLQALARAS